jgi:hypothetical protein
VIRNPRDLTTNSVTLVLHSLVGRQVWAMQLHYAPPPELPKLPAIGFDPVADVPKLRVLP